ncbi:TLR4 interactor with leucine rich repeats-like [Brachionus plicatilis]|uniref:TLR4 interactor with leucine rich repeats-like n=1 Tax=Brachionus plicatilis TaxID=10195 RepID=A0A3M7QNX6_BRAPC|nr:TLR4 interactor with leucine rich repeats-like [Brachionus plicatilis]
MSIILTGQQVHIAKMVKRLTIRRCNIQDANVFQTMKDLSEFANLNELNIQYNNFSNFEFNFTQSFPNLYELDIKLRLSNNNLDSIKLSCLENVTRLSLYFHNNLIKHFSDQNLASLTKLEYLGLGNNMIEGIKLENLKSLKNLYLQSNRIEKIRKNSFSSLSNLQINVNAFKNNKNLGYLYLGSNRLKTIADLSELSVLRYLDLSNNKISRLPNYAFERKISEANIFVTQISINLLNNPIETYSSKSLCSQFSYSFGFAGITLNIDDLQTIFTTTTTYKILQTTQHKHSLNRYFKNNI